MNYPANDRNDSITPALNFFKDNEKLSVRKRFDCKMNAYYELRIYEPVYNDDGYFIGQKNFKTVGKILSEKGVGEVQYSNRFLRARPEFSSIVLMRMQYGKFFARERNPNPSVVSGVSYIADDKRGSACPQL